MTCNCYVCSGEYFVCWHKHVKSTKLMDILEVCKECENNPDNIPPIILIGGDQGGKGT